MKEININIEGYNVNGICVGCLNYGRKMFTHEDVKDCFKLLADIDVSICIFIVFRTFYTTFYNILKYFHSFF